MEKVTVVFDEQGRRVSLFKLMMEMLDIDEERVKFYNSIPAMNIDDVIKAEKEGKIKPR